MKQLGLSLLLGVGTFAFGFFLARHTQPVSPTTPVVPWTQSVKERLKPVVPSAKPAQVPDAASTPAKTSENSVTAWPTRVFQGDELHLVLPVPHGGELAIEDPDQKIFMVCYEATPGSGIQPLMESSKFQQVKEMKLDLNSLKATQDFERMEKVFQKTGWYTIYVSHNLETCDFDYEGRIEVFYSAKIRK